MIFYYNWAIFWILLSYETKLFYMISNYVCYSNIEVISVQVLLLSDMAKCRPQIGH